MIPYNNFCIPSESVSHFHYSFLAKQNQSQWAKLIQLFIQDLEHRRKLTIIEAEGIPMIDLSVLNSGSADAVSNASLVSDIGDGCKKWGFFQVINHGVPLEKREKLEQAAREFFNQSLEKKVKIRRDEVRVYGYYDAEHTKNVRDWKEVLDFTRKNPTRVPASTRPDEN